MYESTLLDDKQIEHLQTLSGPELVSSILYCRDLAPLWEQEFKPRRKSLRRLAYFSDKEGKTRVVALVDYWTQTALRPFHEDLMKILGGLSADCTHDQNKFVHGLASRSFYASIDLSNATDRFPLSLQKRVMARIYGDDISNA